MNCTTLPFCREQVLPVNLSIHFFETATAVPDGVWQRFMPERIHLSADYFIALEQMMKGEMDFRYAVVKQQESTVGFFCFQLVTFRGQQMLNYLPERAENFWKRVAQQPMFWLAKTFLPGVNWRVVVSGNLFMTGDNGLHFSPQLSPVERAQLMSMVLKRMFREDGSLKAFLMPDNYFPQSDFDTEFVQHGFAQIFEEADMSLLVRPEWKSFDDYMNALSSKYRVRAKKVFQQSTTVEQRDLTVEEIEKLQGRLFELYNSVMDNAAFKLATLKPQFFAQQKRLFGGRYRLFGYFLNGELIAFLSVYITQQGAEVHYTGMQYPVCKELHVYQRMLYDMIGFAISQGIRQMHFGRTAPEIKSTVGAVQRPMFGYVKHRSWLLNTLFVKPLAARLKPQEYVLRSPFKD